MSTDIVRALALVGNPRAALDLSPPARALVGALDAGVGQVLGFGTSLSEASADAIAGLAGEIAGSLGDTIAEIVGDVAQVIPIVGPIIKAFTSIITFALSSGESSEQTCSRFFAIFKPKPTGSLLAGGPLVPADLFARVHGIERWYTDKPADYADVRAGIPPVWAFMPQRRRFLPCGPLDCRSALAMSLMQLTEGCIADLRDFDWKLVTAVCRDLADHDELEHLADARAVRRRWGKALERDARIASLQWAKLHPKDHRRGLPQGWRDRFRRLRRGIEASWGGALPAGTSSDGGAVLWIAYLDLLARAFDPAKGYLTWDYAEFLFSRQLPFADKRYAFRGAGTHAWHTINEPLLRKRPNRDYLDDTELVAAPPTWIWGEEACPRMVVDNLRSMVENWQHSVKPAYEQGKTKVAQLEREARAIGREVGARRARSKRVTIAVPPTAPPPAPVTAPPPAAPAVPAAPTPDFDPTPVLVGVGTVGGIALVLRLLAGPRE